MHDSCQLKFDNIQGWVHLGKTGLKQLRHNHTTPTKKTKHQALLIRLPMASNGRHITFNVDYMRDTFNLHLPASSSSVSVIPIYLPTCLLTITCFLAYYFFMFQCTFHAIHFTELTSNIDVYQLFALLLVPTPPVKPLSTFKHKGKTEVVLSERTT